MLTCYMLDSYCFVFIDYALFEFVLFQTWQQFKVTSDKCLECIYFCKVGGVKYLIRILNQRQQAMPSPLDCFL